MGDGADLAQPDSLASVLSDFASHMLLDFDVQAILDLLVERIVDVLGVTGAGVTLISAGHAPHYIAASDGAALSFERLQTSLGQGPCVSAFESGTAVAVPDLRSDDRFPLFAPAAVAAGLAAVFTFPLRHGDSSPRLGALDLYRSTPGDMEENERRAAQTLADVAAAYLLNAQAREQLRVTSARFEELALRDPLTGLANRLVLQDRLEHAANRATRSRRAFGVLYLDLDRFKEVNDMHGHAAGDLLLVEVARRLTALLRPGDTLARVSGDEFVLLLEDLTLTRDAEHVADRITQALREPYVEAGVQLPMAASIGVAVTAPDEVITPQLVIEADRAMYLAKAAGGDTHRIANREPPDVPTAAVIALDADPARRYFPSAQAVSGTSSLRSV
jgi:diguanylate cyclase (GGDEF)-like protein